MEKTHITGQQPHQYHLVNPSPWPITGAIGLFCLTLGSAMTFHAKTGGKILLAVGIITVLFTMFRWWSDVIKESMADKAHTSPVRRGLRMGMGLFILSE